MKGKEIKCIYGTGGYGRRWWRQEDEAKEEEDEEEFKGKGISCMVKGLWWKAKKWRRQNRRRRLEEKLIGKATGCMAW